MRESVYAHANMALAWVITIWLRFGYEHVHDALLAMLLPVLYCGYLDAHTESHLNVGCLLQNHIYKDTHTVVHRHKREYYNMIIVFLSVNR